MFAALTGGGPPPSGHQRRLQACTALHFAGRVKLASVVTLAFQRLRRFASRTRLSDTRAKLAETHASIRDFNSMDTSRSLASARGATRAERVEICLFTGRAAEAVRLAEEAMDEQRVGGRRSMAWRAEASRVRALVQAGLTVPQRVLDPGLDFAVERRLLLLEADLRLARSEIAGPRAEQDLERVLELQTGSWIREGRALLALAERRRNPAIARQAAEQLRPSVPWSKRAEALISDLLS